MLHLRRCEFTRSTTKNVAPILRFVLENKKNRIFYSMIREKTKIGKLPSRKRTKIIPTEQMSNCVTVGCDHQFGVLHIMRIAMVYVVMNFDNFPVKIISIFKRQFQQFCFTRKSRTRITSNVERIYTRTRISVENRSVSIVTLTF